MPSPRKFLVHVVVPLLLARTLTGAATAHGLDFIDELIAARHQCSSAEEPPPLPPGVSREDWARTEEILGSVWASGDGYGGAEVGVEFTYGEVTVKGVRQLASSLFTVELPARSPQAQTREAASRKQIVFYDLGSGVGRLTAQICLDHLHSAHLSIGKLVGVELSGARHDIAARARDHLFRVSDGCGGAIQYRHSDAQLVDFSDATHLYIASLCFPAAVVAAIAERIRTGHAPDLQVVASLSDMAALESAGWTKTTANIQASWGSARLRLYRGPSLH